MTKIEELIDSVYYLTDSEPLTDVHVSRIMKEYAEYYAKKCLDVAMNNVKFQFADMVIEGSSHKEIIDLDYEQTFNFKLPEHE